MIGLLLDAGADVNNPETRIARRPMQDSFLTALLEAVKTKDVKVVEYILECRADPDDALAFAEASLAQDPVIMNLLLKQHMQTRSHPTGLPRSGGEVLKAMIDRNLHEEFRALLDRGVNANTFYRDMSGHLSTRSTRWLGPPAKVELTPFGYAIARPHGSGLRFVEVLLQQQERTKCGPESIVSRIGRAGRDEPVAQVTAFLAVIGSGHLETVKLLLRYKADVNFPAKLGVKRTPLQRAVEIGDQEIVQLLLDHGADVNAPAAHKDGGTALHFAAIQGFIPIARLLLKYGADLDALGSRSDGRTCLEGAAEHGRLDMVFMLLERGAASGGYDQAQLERAKELAERKGHYHIASMLDHYITCGELSVKDEPFFPELVHRLT